MFDSNEFGLKQYLCEIFSHYESGGNGFTRHVNSCLLKVFTHFLLINMTSYVMQVLGNAVIRQIVFCRNGEFLLKILRTASWVFENLFPRNGAVKALAFLIDQKEKGVNMSRDVSFLKFTQDFRDTVNKMHRKVTCFNGDCECIVGASCSKGEYKIHIWNRLFITSLSLKHSMLQNSQLTFFYVLNCLGLSISSVSPCS